MFLPNIGAGEIVSYSLCPLRLLQYTLLKSASTCAIVHVEVNANHRPCFGQAW